MSKSKDLRDIGVTVLALGTAYGLGILSCVYFELVTLAKVMRNTSINVGEQNKKEETPEGA